MGISLHFNGGCRGLGCGLYFNGMCFIGIFKVFLGIFRHLFYLYIVGIN